MIALSGLGYFFMALAGTGGLLYLCLRFKINFGLIAPPNIEVITHITPVPLIGGLLIFLTCLPLTFLVLNSFGFELDNLMLGIVPVLFLGLYKDKIQKPFSPFIQFFIQGVSSYFLYRQWLLVNSMEFDWLWLTVLILICNFLLNAYNFLDVSDGLAGSYSAILFLIIALSALMIGQLSIFFLTTILLGSNLAFLFFNWYPAKVFLGDMGTFGLMYMLLFAAITRFTFENLNTILGLFFVFFVPLFEFSFTILRRILLRRLPYEGDDNHASLILLNKGWHSSKIAFSFIIATILSCGIGLFLLS